MTPTISWPSHFPRVLLEARSSRTISPIAQTRLASGRIRRRRLFTSVPVEHRVSWVMGSSTAEDFEDFYREDLIDGTQWFWMPFLLPQGVGPWPVRFVDIYEGPNLVGRPSNPLWSYSATIEQWSRPGTQ